MVRLEITIKELTSIDLEKATAIGTEIAIKEIEKNASKNEKEVSNILKKRLKIEEKIQVESSKKEQVDELKQELLDLLKSL